MWTNSVCREFTPECAACLQNDIASRSDTSSCHDVMTKRSSGISPKSNRSRFAKSTESSHELQSTPHATTHEVVLDAVTYTITLAIDR